MAKTKAKLPVAELLRRASLFEQVSAKALSELVEGGVVESFRAGEFIFRDGDPADSIFCLLEGRVRIMSTTADGRTQLHSVLEPGSVFGELGVVGGMPRAASADALADSSVWSAESDFFIEFLRENPDVSLALMAALARQVVAQDGLVEDLLFLDLRARVAKRLLALVARSWDELPDDGTPLPWDLTQSDLANLCGGTRENVNRILSDFQKRRFVERSGRRYVLANVKALARLAKI